ncbi:MAG: tetratricopeptide repeat protein [Myxococcota bacterium]
MTHSPSPLLKRVEDAVQSGHTHQARELAMELLDSAKHDFELLLRQATTVHELGLPDIAESAFRRMLRRNPTNDDLLFRWTVFRMVTGHVNGALETVNVLLGRHDTAELHALRGLVLRRLGRHDEAALALQVALRRNPTRVEWWSHVGDLRMEQRRIDDAIRAYNSGLVAIKRTAPQHDDKAGYLLSRLSDCFARSNLIEEAWRFSASALALNPHDVRARWNDLQLLPVIYQDAQQIRTVRRRYDQRLTELAASLKNLDIARCSQAVAGMKLPFYLHYHGGPMQGIMARYGAVVDDLMRCWQPALRAAPDLPAPSGRIRVGFASYLFRRHTVTKLFGGWIRDLDRRRFEVFTYHLGPAMDDSSQALAQASDHFVHLPAQDAATVCRRMRQDALHVTIFPELGMSVVPIQVASLRTAPVQAVAWGHPVTTGLAGVDLFLSSDAMEPPDAQDHYTETLVRLPGLSIAPEPPIRPSSRNRASFGLRDEDFVILVPQSLFKLLPDEDAPWCRLLQEIPNSRLVFLHHHNPTVTGLFQRRLHTALAEHGLSSDRVAFIPALQWADYLALNREADVFLDGLSWSGGTTTFEALAMGLVPVTLPGSVMRGRHTAAILREIDAPQTIATDLQHRHELVVRLATDPQWRRELQAQIARALPKLYADKRPIRGLERLLQRAVCGAYQRKLTPASGTT